MKDYNDSHSGREKMIEELGNSNFLVSFAGCLFFVFLMALFFLILSYVFIDGIFDLLLMVTNL